MNQFPRTSNLLASRSGPDLHGLSMRESPVQPWTGRGIWPGLLSGEGLSLLELLPQALFDRSHMTLRSLTRRIHLISDPSLARGLLHLGPEHVRKPVLLRRLLQPMMGRGLMLTEDDIWRTQRRSLAPAFSPRALDSYIPILQQVAKIIHADVSSQCGPAPQEVLAHSTKATLSVIRQILFGASGGPDQARIDAAFVKQLRPVGILRSFLAYDSAGRERWPGPAPEVAALMSDLHSATGLELARPASPDSPIAALARLAPGCPMSGHAGQDLDHNILTLLVAGFDTTAVALAWAVYLVALDPALQDSLAAEARKALPPGHQPTARHLLTALPLTRSVIQETLRLYPPAPFVARSVISPVQLGDLSIRKRDLVMVSIYAMQRHRRHWPAPGIFDPFRFMASNAFGNPAFMPFGSGPRICIGQQLAELELILFLASLMRSFHFAPVPGHDPQPRLTLTLRPENGIRVSVRPRHHPT